MSYLQGVYGPYTNAIRFSLGGGEIGAVPAVVAIDAYQKLFMPTLRLETPLRFDPNGGRIRQRPAQATWGEYRWTNGKRTVFWRGEKRKNTRLTAGQPNLVLAHPWAWAHGISGRIGYVG